MRKIAVLMVLGMMVLGVGLGQTAQAERYQSPNYTIDASVGNSFGGDSDSTSYKLTASGGESIIGNGEGGSYKLGQGYVAQLERSLQLTVQPKGLKAYYPFDELAGSAARDAGVNDYNGQYTDGASTGTDAQIGRSLQLDGLNDRVLVDYPTDFEYSGGNMSFGAWIKPAASETESVSFISKPWNGVGAYNYRLNWNPGGSVTLLIAPPSGDVSTILTGSNSAPVSTWSYVFAVLRSDKTMELFINGKSAATGSHTITDWADGMNTNRPLTVGCLYPFLSGWAGNASFCFDGKVDEVKFYERALNASELEAEYDAGVTGNPAGLAFPEEIIGGTSQATEADVVVQTDAPGYNINISQNSNLTSMVSTIPGISSGSVASPLAWSEGTTKGLGFTLTGSNATPIAAKWNSGAGYAALPNSSTSIYTRSGYTSGSKDVTSIKYRLDVDTTQASGKYTNIVTYTGVMTP